MTTPAPKRGLVSDAPTGRLNFSRMDPSDGLRDGSVRTSFSVPTGLRFSPPSRGSRSGRSASCSTTISTALAVAEATAGANRGRNHGRKQAPFHGGLTRPAEPHPTGRHRVRGKAQSRLIDCRRQAKAAVGGSDE